MNENNIPKWQRELRAFLGIKSGIILEGNVYDEYPFFCYEGGETRFEGVDNLDQTILSLQSREKTAVFFFDPIYGVYCYGGSLDDQRQILEPLFEDYRTTETTINYGCTLCLMPEQKAGENNRGNAGSGADTRRYIWVSEIIRAAVSSRIQIPGKENITFVVNFASRLEACNLRSAESNTMFLNLLAATTASQQSQIAGNSLIMVVDKYNDIPAWVYLNNPNIRTISVCVPDRSIRRMYLQNLYGELAPFELLSREDYAPGKQFVAETEGMQLQEIRQILRMAYQMDIKPDDISLAFRLYKYGVLENPWKSLEKDILTRIQSNLEGRVKGQGEALQKVRSVVTRAVKGLSGLQHSGASHKPKGILFFAGPTGVGKTETAKALAESIFGDENACIRFDMSEYREAHSDQKLFGAPPGYVGYEGGGQLTNAVRNRPFSVLLFDEIEKASPTILDKFLQILEDGRMTDNQGNTVYFGETIIIFTSNIGLTQEVADPNDPFGARRRVPTITIADPMVEDSPEFRQGVTEQLTQGVKDYFHNIGRPELLNRLGDNNIVIFQFINKPDAMLICDAKLKNICRDIRKELGIEVLTDDVTELLRQKAVLERSNGGRGIGNMLEREFLNPLADFISSLPDTPDVLRCHPGADGHIEFEVICREA